MPREIRRLLIANRGEIAIRIHRACAELGVRTIGIHSYEDRFALHRFKADEAWHIDYCLLSASLLPMVTKVEVAADERWATRSDHRPLSVTLAI